MQLHLGSLRVTRRCSARPPNNWILVFSLHSQSLPPLWSFLQCCFPVLYDRSFSSCPAICKHLVMQTRAFRELRLPFPVFLETHLCLSCATLRRFWGLNLITCSGPSVRRGYFGIFLIVTTCLDDCDALSPCGAPSSLNHAHSLRPRGLEAASPYPGSFCYSQGFLSRHISQSFKNPVSGLREQISIHLNLCSVSIIRMIYST